MNIKDEISKKVNVLIEENIDAHKRFHLAEENAESSTLKSYLLQQAIQRHVFANDLSINLKAYNPDFNINPKGSFTGSLHRTWINIKTSFSGDTDNSILEECIRGDEASVEEYQEFLENYPTVSQEIKYTIQQQLGKIKTTLNRETRLENLH